MRKCSVCGKEWADHISFCGECGNVTVEVEVIPVEKKRPKKRLIILIAAVSALSVLLGAGAFTDWFGLISPVHRLARVAKRTFTADSYTVTVTQKHESDTYDYEQKVTTKQVVDEKAKKVTTYNKGHVEYVNKWGDESYESEYDSVYVVEKDTEYYYNTSDGDITRASIYELEDYSKNILKEREMWKEPDWKEYIKDNELEDYLKANKMDDLINEVMKEYLTNRRWLKNTAGYTRKGNTYTFKPDVKELLEDLLDVADGSRTLTKQAKEYMEEEFADTIEAIDDGDLDVDVELVITIKGFYLSNVRMVIISETDDSEFRQETEYAYSDVGKTEIAPADIKKVKNKVNEWLDDQGIVYDICSECEELSNIYKDQMCSSCYNTCADCGEYGSIEVDDQRYCSDCYYVCVYCGEYGNTEVDGQFYCTDHDELCNICGQRCDYVYESDGKDWCYDCYYTCVICSKSASYTIAGKRYCSSCRYVCAECGNRSDSIYTVGSEEWCYDCYKKCASCGSGSASYTENGKRYCSSCRYTCDKCSKRCNTTYTVDSQSWCYTCYKKCAYCGNSSASYTTNGKRYCYSCRYYCDECGDRCSYTYSVGSEDWCEDCYDECYYCGGNADYTVNGKRCCSYCRYECDECGHRCSYTYYVNGEEWCSECYYTCEECGGYASDTYNGKRYCWTCYCDIAY